MKWNSLNAILRNWKPIKLRLNISLIIIESLRRSKIMQKYVLIILLLVFIKEVVSTSKISKIKWLNSLKLLIWNNLLFKFTSKISTSSKHIPHVEKLEWTTIKIKEHRNYYNGEKCSKRNSSMKELTIYTSRLMNVPNN